NWGRRLNPKLEEFFERFENFYRGQKVVVVLLVRRTLENREKAKGDIGPLKKFEYLGSAGDVLLAEHGDATEIDPGLSESIHVSENSFLRILAPRIHT